MAVTTIKISTELRDRLSEIAEDYGATLADALQRLIDEHEERAALAAYERLRSNTAEWASYQNESLLTDGVAGDWAHGEETP
jgi:predicted transcriptional regulator